MPQESRKITIDIPMATILRIVGVGLGIWFLFVIADLLFLLLFALVLASAITPFVNWFEDRGVPRVVSLLAVVALLVGILTLMGVTVIPHLASEFQRLAQNVPVYRDVAIEELTRMGVLQDGALNDNVRNVLTDITTFFGEGASSISTIIFRIFGGVIATVTVILSTFYLALSRNGVEHLLRFLTPDREETYIVDLWRRAQVKIGQWARGQLILMVFIGSISFVALTLLNVPFALVLATLAALMEVVPYVGPIVAGSAATAVALFTSPWLALIVLGVYLGIQQLEAQVIVPLLYRKILKLHPVVVIFSLIIGARFGGIAGMVLAIPLTTIITEFLTDYANGKVRT
jgi:predicted PurR-regulated permease PerM